MQTLQNVLTVTFVVSSMLAMGLSLTVRQIVSPLRNVKGVLLALLANFVIVPLAAYLLGGTLGDLDHRIGIIVLGSVAGAPFVIKLTQIAMGDLVLSVTALVVLIVGTVVFVPLTLPLLLPGVEVSAAAIAKNLSLQMLLPLGIGLFAHARYEDGAEEILPDVQKISSVSLVLLLVLLLTTNFGKIVGMFGTGAIAATLGLAVIGLLSGWLLGVGGGPARRATLSLATGTRGIGAAFVVANGSFPDRPEVFVYLAGATVVLLLVTFACAGELRRRSRGRERAAPEPGDEAARSS